MNGLLLSFRAFSALLLATNVVLAHRLSGDYVCTTDTGCSGAVLDFVGDFSLKCANTSACLGSHIVVHSDSTLRVDGIDCTPQHACRNATIDVHSSDLGADSRQFLNCLNSNASGLCMEMNMTLVDSSIALLCGDNDCGYMQVYLFGSSTLELKTATVLPTDSSKALTIYVSEDSTLIDNGVSGYNLVMLKTTSSSSFSDATKFAAIGCVGVALLVCGFCLGKIKCGRKQEQSENEKDAKVEITLVPRTLSEDCGNPGHAPEWVVADASEEQMYEAGADAMSSTELEDEMMYLEMPKDYTPGGHLPHSPEACHKPKGGGAYLNLEIIRKGL